MQKGRFIVSLDFELYWGVRDQLSLQEYGENILGARTVLPELLKVLEAFQIKATFATVGFLFSRTKEDLLSAIPIRLPTYQEKILSPYLDHLSTIGDNEEADPLHFAPSLISLIAKAGHEIGSHTFSHFYCLEDGANLDDFEEDIKAAVKVASRNQINIKSIVFPRNQYTSNHLRICQENGIDTYRGNEKNSIYQFQKIKNENIFRRLLRFIDSYINLTGHHAFILKKRIPGEIYNIPSSKFLRPYNPALSILDGLKLYRIKSAMTFAAKNGLGYHLWWHPHNFGKYQTENLKFLKKILKHYQNLHHQYGFESTAMTDCEKVD